MPTSTDPRRHLAVVPARGGSKRLPRKNIIDFFGRPIIAYTLDAARAAKTFDKILVSTEDREIADKVRDLGADVDERPADLGSDTATVVHVCLEMLERLEQRGESFDTMTVLYATAPLRNGDDVRATHALLRRGACDFAMAGVEFEQPLHQALREQPDGTVVPVFRDLVDKRASAAGRYLAGNGSTYSVFVDRFREQRGFYGEPLRVYVMPANRSVDIDTAEDLELARFYGARSGLGR